MKEATERIDTYLDPETLAAALTLADAEGVTLAAWARNACEDVLGLQRSTGSRRGARKANPAGERRSSTVAFTALASMAVSLRAEAVRRGWTLSGLVSYAIRERAGLAHPDPDQPRARAQSRQPKPGAALSVQPVLEVGAPDGYGRYGIMERGEDSALCHECGRRFTSVASHALAAHQMTTDEYRAAHGLPRTMPLWSLAMSRRIAPREKTCPICGGTYIGQKKRTCSPACARLAASRGAQAQAEGLLRLDDEQAAILRATRGAARRAMISRLQEQGYTSRSIGRAIGLDSTAMSRTYPRA